MKISFRSLLNFKGTKRLHLDPLSSQCSLTKSMLTAFSAREDPVLSVSPMEIILLLLTGILSLSCSDCTSVCWVLCTLHPSSVSSSLLCLFAQPATVWKCFLWACLFACTWPCSKPGNRPWRSGRGRWSQSCVQGRRGPCVISLTSA